MKSLRHALLLLSLVCVLLAGCGDDDETSEPAPTTTAASESTTTSAPADELTIVVTNDDGIGAPGIDALVTALSELDGVELVIVAPAENQSGSSDNTTEGGATSAPGATASGVEGTAVDGFPADAVNVALDELGIDADLVVSGVNKGQNIGPLAAVSGTVGAARTAIRSGVPAVAVSAGLRDETDFAAAATLVVEWIEENRAALLDGSADATEVVSFNIPDCTAGEIRGLVDVPLGDALPEGVDVFETDCSLDAPDGGPASDVDAIVNGFAAETLVPADL